jgi:hypothetical protein
MEHRMNGLTIDALAERLEQLEQENRRLVQLLGRSEHRRGLLRRLRVPATLVIVLALIGAGGEDKPKVVQANRVELQDAKGKARAFLGVFGDKPGLIFLDEKGTTRLEIALESDARPAIRFISEDDKTQAALGVSPGGDRALTLYDKDERERLSFGTRENGFQFLNFLDEKGRHRISLHVRPNGQQAQLVAYDTDEEPRVAMGVGEDGLPICAVMDKGRTRQVHMIADAKGNLSVGFRSKGGSPRGGIGLTQDGRSGIDLFDKDGKPRAGLHLEADGTPKFQLLDSDGRRKLDIP